MKKIILLIATIILLFSISYASENKWQILRGVETGIIVSKKIDSNSVYSSEVIYEKDTVNLYNHDFSIFSSSDRIFEKNGNRLTIYIPKNKIDNLRINIDNVYVEYKDNKVTLNVSGNIYNINNHAYYYMDKGELVTTISNKAESVLLIN